MIFSFLPPESKICGKYNIIVVGYQYFLLNSLGKTGRFLIKVVKQGHTSNNCYSNKNPAYAAGFFYLFLISFLLNRHNGGGNYTGGNPCAYGKSSSKSAFFIRLAFIWAVFG